MKKILFLFTLILCFIAVGCTNPNESENTPTPIDPTTDVVTEELTSPNFDDETKEEDSTFIINQAVYDYFSNDSHLSEDGKNAINLINNALDASTETENDQSGRKYAFRNNNEDKMELNNAILEKSGFYSKDSSMSNFISNMLNIKKEIIKLEPLLGSSACYYLDEWGYNARAYEYSENNIKYFSFSSLNNEVSLGESGKPSNITYFEITYNPEDDTYFYEAIMYLDNMICLYNQSDLKNYCLVYQDVFNSNDDILAYFNFNELESKVDSNGNPKDFSEYGNEAYKHIYMPFCQRYYGYEKEEDGYYHTLINALIDKIVLWANDFEKAEVSYELIVQKLDEMPYVDNTMFYLTCGFTKPIINVIEIGERPSVYALMSMFSYSDNPDYHLLLETENTCMEINPYMLCEEEYYYVDGVFDIELTLGDLVLEFKLYCNQYFYVTVDSDKDIKLILANYSKNEHFAKVLEYLTNDYYEVLPTLKDEILEYVNTNINDTMFDSVDEYNSYIDAVNNLMNLIY